MTKNKIDLTHTFAEAPGTRFCDLSEDHKTYLDRYERLIWPARYDKYRIYAYSMVDQVFPGIWVGGLDAAENHRFLTENAIGVILDLQPDPYDVPLPESIKHYKISFPDGKATPVGVFEKAAEIINDAVDNGQPILVHCAAGVSRSVTAVCTYQMLYNGMGFQDAINKVAETRGFVNPHHLLIRSLMRDVGGRFKV